jgi:hypothetical protein
MSKHRKLSRVSLFVLLGLAALTDASCSSSSNSNNSAPPPYTGPVGQECMSVAQCYGGIDAGALSGPVACLSVTGGYCTHTCTTDTDCCAVAGECPDGHAEVCSPFESEPSMYCMLSCEAADTADAGVTDANAYCARFANPNFTCRSTGGGASNRMVCAP